MFWIGMNGFPESCTLTVLKHGNRALLCAGDESPQLGIALSKSTVADLGRPTKVGNEVRTMTMFGTVFLNEFLRN